MCSPKGRMPPQREVKFNLKEEFLPATISPKVSSHSQHVPGRSDSPGPQQYDQTERSCRQIQHASRSVIRKISFCPQDWSLTLRRRHQG